MEFYPGESQNASRTNPMLVLVLGLPRTGTSSICAALRTLGIRPYHFSEISKNKNNRHFEQWLAAVRAKYDGVGELWQDKRDFDRVLWNYEAVTDDPCCLFVQELMTAYPDAKLILTTRSSSEQWYNSMKTFILEILAWKRSYSLLSFFDVEFTKPYMNLLNRTTRVLSQGIDPTTNDAATVMKEYYDNHIRDVRSEALRANRKLLVFESSMGWTPLCEFLDRPVPDAAVPYPHLNSTQEALKLEWALYWNRWNVAAQKLLPKLLMLLALALTIRWRL